MHFCMHVTGLRVCTQEWVFLLACARCSHEQSLHVLQGDLSLMADKGHAGIPLGHVIAYKADHEMHIEFAKKLKASCGPIDVVLADKA